MKLLWTIICVIIFTQVSGQKFLDNEEAYYKFATDIVIYDYNFLDQKVDTTKRFIGEYNRSFFRIDDLKEDRKSIGKYYVIKSSMIKRALNTVDQRHDTIEALRFDTLTSNNSSEIVLSDTVEKERAVGAFNLFKSKTKTYYYYAVKVDDFLNKNVVARYDQWKPHFSVATLLIPVKLRPKFTRGDNVDVPFEFTSDFTLGTSFGLKSRIHKYKDHFVNVLAGIGLTSVKIDSTSTNGFISEKNLNLSAFTLSVGLVFEVSGFQVGTFLGNDYLGGEVGPNWSHQGKTWIALGVGYQLMTRVKKDPD